MHDPPLLISRDLPRVAALQYSWIGDGFCWNYVAQIDDQQASQVILGMCYHLDEKMRIRLRRPHVGYFAGPGKLIWVTAKEVFFEEVLPEKADRGLAYAITGFVYQIHGGALTNDGGAFQAIYTQHTDHRPPWHKFPVDLRVGGVGDAPQTTF